MPKPSRLPPSIRSRKHDVFDPDLIADYLVQAHKAKLRLYDRVLAKLAEDTAKEARTRIKKQIGIIKNAKQYRKYKKRNRLDVRALVSSGKYMKSIQAKRLGFLRYSVGPYGMRPRKKANMLWHVLEFGREDGHIPPRPHIGPAMKKAKRELLRALRAKAPKATIRVMDLRKVMQMRGTDTRPVDAKDT